VSISVVKTGSVVRALLADELTVADAADVYGRLFAELDAEATLVVDASGVTRVDTTVVQLVLFASRCVRELRIEAQSVAWASAWTTLGLPQEFHGVRGRG
jgi:anti-anti-sigma regulatory factor